MTLEEKLNTEIKELQTLMLAKNYLVRINASIAAKNEEIVELEEVVDLEYQDIEMLERKSLRNIFTNILGDVQQQMDKEKQEYLDAVLNYKDAKRLLKLLKQDAKMLNEEVREINEQQLLVEGLMIKREQQIEESNLDYKSEYLQYCRKIDEALAMNTEILDAKLVGLKCKQYCQDVITHLEQAAELREWGFENNNDDRSAEKSNVDRAVESYYLLKMGIEKFEVELNDIYEDRQPELSKHLTQFNTFKKVYYDFLINDWIIKSRLANTISVFEVLKTEIIKVYQSLELTEKQTDELIDKSEAEKKRIVSRA